MGGKEGEGGGRVCVLTTRLLSVYLILQKHFDVI